MTRGLSGHNLLHWPVDYANSGCGECGSKSAYAQAKLDAYYTATLLGLPIGHISWVIVSALGQSASGSTDVADDHVRLEVFLPWFLAKLVGTIQPLIRKEGTLLLEKKK